MRAVMLKLASRKPKEAPCVCGGGRGAGLCAHGAGRKGARRVTWALSALHVAKI